MTGETERESMEFDVVIVGGGPAGLSAAIRLKQLNPELSVVVLEKGAEVGAHILSGAVVDPVGVDRLLPDWRDEADHPFKTPVNDDQFLVLGPAGSVRLPNFLMPPLMNNHGNYFVSESSVYRLLKAHDLITSPAFIVIKAADEFHDKTTAPNQLWQTDFTYLKVIGWGWFYLSTVLDDFSRYIIAWKLCTTMKAGDVTDTLTIALQASGCDNARVMQRPRLLSDNGPSYVFSDLAAWLSSKGMEHTRGAPCHPQTQGKIERWHQTLKNRILLENYFLPGDLEQQIAAFVDHYSHRRYHESLDNLTPADVYFGRGDIITLERERIKRETIKQRRLLHRDAAA